MEKKLNEENVKIKDDEGAEKLTTKKSSRKNVILSIVSLSLNVLIILVFAVVFFLNQDTLSGLEENMTEVEKDFNVKINTILEKDFDTKINMISETVSVLENDFDAKINIVAEIQEKVESVDKKLSDIEIDVMILEWDQEFLETKQTVTFDLGDSKGYQIMETNSGLFFVIVEKAEEYLDGYKITLRIGNPQSCDYSGFDLEVKWGEKYEYGSGDSKVKWITKEGGVPAIVSVDTWEKVNAILYEKRKIFKIEETEKARIAGYFKGSYAYSGKIRCGTCGHSYWHQTYSSASKKFKKEYNLWQCSRYRSFGKNSELGCENPHIENEELDKIVKTLIFDFWNNKDGVIDNIIKVLDESFEEEKSKESNNKFETEIAKNEKRKENLINMRMNGEISKEEFAKQKDKIESVLLDLNKQIHEVGQKSKGVINKKKRLLQIKGFLSDKLKSPEGIDDEIIKHFLKKVIIKEDCEITIILDGDFDFIFKKNGKDYILCK